MDDIKSRIYELFELANINGNLAIRVSIDDKGGYKTYLTNEIDEPPVKVIDLNNLNEEKIFRLFRFPELENEEIKREVERKILHGSSVEKLLEKGIKIEELIPLDPTAIEDYTFKNKYFSGGKSLLEIRSNLRSKYKDQLINQALSITLPEKTKEKEKEETKEEEKEEAKPVYKSKTILTNIIVAFIITVARYLGIELTVEQVTAFLSSINIALRFLTKSPIKLKP
ncbi:MAG: hypothetical protein QXY41_07370 [Thermoproteota archaeon]